MKKQSFERWLKNIKRYKESTIGTRIANCLKIEETYGDLDEQYKKDKLNKITEELSTINHDIPIDGNRYTATATYRSTLKLYLEFKENKTLDRIMTMENIDPDKHDGSYKLIRETVESLSKIDIKKLGLKDLDMLSSMAVGTWKMSVDVKKDRIKSSNLIDKEKIRIISLLEKVWEKAENRQYENREKDEASIGMFGTGFWTFTKNTNDEGARKFISLIVEIKDLDDEDRIFNILEEGFKDGISGIQTGSASMILHCLKPNVFPILNGLVAKSIVVLEGKGVILNNPTVLTNYIENTKILKNFRDENCKFKNYRTLDKALWEMSLVAPPNEEIDKAWFVGSAINGEDYTDKFIKKGIWKSGHEDKFQDAIKSIEVGDIIAIKSTYTRKYNLPFESNDNYASIMSIKATGVVKRNLEDGKTLEVDWVKIEPRKEWYFFTMRETIWKVEREDDDWMYGELLDFTFNDKPQNIERFINHPYWADRYSMKTKNGGKISIKTNYHISFNQTLNFGNLYFSDPKSLKDQISIAFKSGKSIILIGPPGTGKSKIAKEIARSYGADSKMVTAMSDWSSYDTIGGYKPTVDGDLYFEEGIFLSSFKSKKGQNLNKWLIIDEINRADIDKAFGPFFSALSADDVELGLKDSQGRNIEILLEENLRVKIEEYETENNQYIIPNDWRIIGTMNTFDKTSLYEMSYAFMRRFAFIPVSIPKDIDGSLVEKFFELWKINLDFNECENISDLWKIINKYRKIGPAIIEDIGKFISLGGDYTSAVVIYILPQLEGLFTDDISKFVGELKALNFINDEPRLVESIEDFFNTSLSGE